MHDFAGEIFENHREEWLPGFTVGPIHNTEWGLPAENKLRSSTDSVYGRLFYNTRR